MDLKLRLTAKMDLAPNLRLSAGRSKGYVRSKPILLIQVIALKSDLNLHLQIAFLDKRVTEIL